MRERVVRVSAGQARGTGVLVAADRVATALHVVADRGVDPPRLYGPIVLGFAALREDRWAFAEAEATLEAFDRVQDLALLRFDPAELPFTPAVQRLRALAEEELPSTPGWQSFGFPDASPTDGGPVTGSVQTTRAAQGEVRAIALFCHEAAAGRGMPVAGLSGAPVFVEGQVVGLLRWALTDQERYAAELPRGEGGTLYAVPVERLPPLCPELRLGGRPPLPPLPPDMPLSVTPFRWLQRYEAGDAPIFFGRSGALRAFFALLGEAPPDRILLLLGPSGVGKSSFLRAGVLPRLPYAASLKARPPGGLAEGFRALPSTPLRVLDQVEEAWTRGRGEAEMAELARALAEAVGPTGGRVVLSFRKEWLPEVEDGLRAHGLRWERFLLGPLDRAGVKDTLEGLVADPRLAEWWGLELEPGLTDRLADAVLTGAEDAVAPVLQVALTRMWERTDARARASGSTRHRFTREVWEEVVAEGLGLPRFLDQQFRALHTAHPEATRGGLDLEVLAQHITPAGSGARRTDEELAAAFVDGPRAVELARALQDLWLLTGDGPGARRLAHDSLAGVVAQARAGSTAPAQAMARRIEALVPYWREGREGPLLSREDLRLYRHARPFLRVLDADEARLVEATVAHFALPRRVVRVSLEVTVALLAFALVITPALLLLDTSEAVHRSAMRGELDRLLVNPATATGVTDRLRSAPLLPVSRVRGVEDAGIEEALPRIEWMYRRGRAGEGIALEEPRWGRQDEPALARDPEGLFELAAWLDGRRDVGLPPPEMELQAWHRDRAWIFALDRLARGLDPGFLALEDIPWSLRAAVPWVERERRGEQQRAPEPDPLRALEATTLSPHERPLAALEAIEAGRLDLAGPLAADLAGGDCGESNDLTPEVLALYARLGDEAAVRACVDRDVETWRGRYLRQSQRGSALLAVGLVEESAALALAARPEGEPWHLESDIEFVAGLAAEGQAEAARRVLDRWMAGPSLGNEALLPRVLGIELPLWGAWFVSSQDAELCSQAALLAVGYARIGDARMAHLLGRHCDHPWVRGMVYTQALTVDAGHPTWLVTHLERWTGPDALRSTWLSADSYARLWLLDTTPTPELWRGEGPVSP